MYTILCIVIAIFSIILYQKRNLAYCKSKKKLYGKTAVVTGRTAGIGFQIALDLAKRGARVIVACPLPEEGIHAERSIRKKSNNSNVSFHYLDLSSLQSVRNFASRILKEETRLDILVNNAGFGVPGDSLTKDGLNFIMQVNFYGYFLLSLLLLPLLKKSGTRSDPSRIVNASSNLCESASLDVDNYNRVGFWGTSKIYSNSKLCFVLFSSELSKRLKDSNVIVNNAIASGIFERAHVIFGILMRFFAYVFFKTPWQSAQTAIYVAVDEEAGLVSGKEFRNCKLVDTKLQSDIDTAAKKLWEQSITLVKLEEEELLNNLK